MSGLAIVLSFAALAICAFVRPHAARCPAGTDLRTGIRRDGSFECWPHPVGDPEWDGTWQRPERSRQPSWFIAARIYCTSGAQPIVVDDRVVGCTR